MKPNRSAILLLLCLVLISGCKEGATRPVDVAAEAGVQLSKAYLLIYDTAKYMTEHGTPEQIDFALDVLNPAVNRAKHAVASLDTAIAIWQRTGQGEEGVLAAQENMKRVFADLQSLVTQIYALGGGSHE